MDPIVVSKENARGFLVKGQGFGAGKGKKGVRQTIKRLECIQIDPVSVVHRNHQLVLHSRVIEYKSSHLAALLYKDRALFEYWCNGKSIIPIEDFRYFNYRMQNFMEFHSPFYERLKARRQALKAAIAHVLASIKADGPLSAPDFSNDQRVNSKTAQRVLNFLWDCGEVMVHHVEKNRRCYDLTERVLPSEVDTEVPSKEEYERFMIEKYLRAYRLNDSRDWRFGWLELDASQRKVIVEELVRGGQVCPVRIENVRQVYYVLENDVDALVSAGAFSDEKVRFLAPLDNLIWNRRMVCEVFDFDYAWEIYKPPKKRVYGYYVLPIMQDSRFVGRMDPKLDRQSNTMIVSLFLEEEHFSKAFICELAAALKSFLQFHHASKIEIIQTKPTGLKNELFAEVNFSG